MKGFVNIFQCLGRYIGQIHDDFNTDKVGFVKIYESCILETCNAFYVMSHWESQLGTGLVFKTGFCVPNLENISSGKFLTLHLVHTCPSKNSRKPF